MQDKILELLNEVLKGQRELKNMLREYSSKMDVNGMVLSNNTDVLNALEENARVTRAEIDKLNHAGARLSGELLEIKKELKQVEMVTENNINDIYELKLRK